MLKVGFLSSSTWEGFEEYQRDIEQILEDLFFFDKDLVVINGGYKGLMEVTSRIAENIKAKKDGLGRKAFGLIRFGILFDGYLQDPKNNDPSRSNNQPNPHNDFYVSAASLGERAQNLIQLSDVIVALPGSSGTLHEILHCIEHIKYGRNYEHHADFKRLVLHRFWDVGRLKHLNQVGLIKDEVYEQLFFWSPDRRAILLKHLDEIKAWQGSPRRAIPTVPSTLQIYDMESHRYLPDSSPYHLFIRELNAYLQGDYQREYNHVLGLDVVIVDINEQNILELLTIGIRSYARALSEFIDTKGSILSNISFLKQHRSHFKCLDLSNIVLQRQTSNLFRWDFTKDSKKTPDVEPATFSDWAAHLQKKKVGKTVMWITLPALGESYLVSAFLTFDIFIPELAKPRIRSMLTAFLYDQTLTRLHYKLNQGLLEEAIRAAISQVMARNMSHNIGSHVLSKFKNKDDLQSVPDIENQYDGNSLKLLSDDSIDREEQIAYFNEYLKNRMDFLADIATSDPVMENGMMLREEIIKAFDRNRILLNRISGVSDDAFRYKLVLKKNGRNLVKGEDVALSITNDVLGAQAFYILLENIIRNVAKHSRAEGHEKGHIEIVIDVTEFVDNRSYYEVLLYDNLKRPAKRIDEVVVARNRTLDQSVLKNNRLRDDSLGTIEMDVCAAYLRGLPITSIKDRGRFKIVDEVTGEVIPSNPSEPKLLQAYNHTLDADSDGHSLGYKLYIGKPKEVLVIDDLGTFKIDGVSSGELMSSGIDVVKSSEAGGTRVFNHQIRYYHSASENNLDSEWHATLPKRIVGNIGNQAFSSPKHFVRALWEHYATSQILPEGASVRIINGAFRDRVIKSQNNQLVVVDDPDCEAAILFIDNHNTNWCQCQGRQPEDCICRSDLYQGPGYAFYDMACSHSWVHRYRERLTSGDVGSYDGPAKAQYLEAVHSKILILDERIQENICLSAKRYHGPGGDTSIYQYLKQQNVIIPTRDQADLNLASFREGEADNSVAFKISRFVSNEIGDTRFCVVHLGVLEKMLDVGSSKARAMEEVIEELFPGDSRHKVIITSGRGKPNNLPPDISFVPLALIQNAVETMFDKVLLTKILFNSRRAI